MQTLTDAPVAPGFGGLGLADPLMATLAALGYEEPTPIQREAIPTMLAGRDLLGQAGTGTGKTAAFALPILQHLSSLAPEDRRTPSALILVPTRELAMQVAEAVHRYGKSMSVNVLPVYGGQPMQVQLRALRRGVDVVVATPGRIVDHITRGSIDLTRVRTAVLDEADEMLDMGFADDLEAILGALPADRQTALFSATVAPRIATIARAHLRDPMRITIEREAPRATGTPPRIREVAYVVARQHKIEALGRVLDMENPTAAIVFCRTRTEVDQLSDVLGARGYSVDSLHGGLEQEQRDRVMRRFRDGTIEMVVATDVAARGLDIEHVSHVVNFDVPSDPDAYVHRIGRTGRAGRTGVAITLLEPKEQRLLRSVEHTVKRKIAIENVPTAHDIRARRTERTSTKIREELEGGGHEPYRVIAEALSTDYDLLDIAAAAIKLANEADEAGDKAASEIALDARRDVTDAPSRDRAAPHRAARFEPRERDARRDTRRDGPPKKKKPRSRGIAGEITRLFVPLGKKAGIRPTDIVGAIANEARIDPKLIGSIEISDNFSLIEVPDERADEIIDALRSATIRGNPVKVRREKF